MLRATFSASLALLAGSVAFAAAPSFTLVGSGSQAVSVLDVSHNGQIVVGVIGPLGEDAFRWTLNEGLVNLGSEGGFSTISGDGQTIYSSLADTNFPNLPAYQATNGPAKWLGFAQWENITGMVGPCDQTLGWVRDTNNDGGRLVGGYWVGQCTTNAYLRTPTTFTRLRSAILLGGSSVANAVSDDGSVVVGFNNGPGVGGRTGVIWTPNTSTNAQFINNNFNIGELQDVSPDGRYVVGRGFPGTNAAFRWDRQTNTILQLPAIGGGVSAGYIPLAVSGDGRVVVGQGAGPAFIWEEGVGSRALDQVVTDAGLTIDSTALPGGLFNPTTITPDGRFIAGWGPGNGAFDRQGWIFDRGGADPCVADVDNGSGTGVPDGGVAIEDLLFYLDIFAQGLVRADIDNGTATGTPDGGVTIDDLLYYLVRFAEGC